MRALPEHGTWRPFTEAEFDRMGLPFATVEGFMKCVMTSLIDKPGFYPPQGGEHGT